MTALAGRRLDATTTRIATVETESLPPADCALALTRPSPMQVLPCKCPEDHNHAVCPYAHPLEKARRRDVRAVAYIDAACPDFRKARWDLIPSASLGPMH